MAELLTDDDVQAHLWGSEWKREAEQIVRDWKFEDFRAAVAFVNRLADAAEEANHHPDILIHGWNKVRLSVTNHSAGGLAAAAFDRRERWISSRECVPTTATVRRVG